MPLARGIPGLLAGLLLFDLLMNLPGFTPSAPFASLLVPSIDLLIVVALCMGAAQAGESALLPLRVAVSVFALGLAACAAGMRFGFDIESRLFGQGSPVSVPAGWAVSLLLLAAAGTAAFLLSGLLVRGLRPQLFRSVVLLVIAAAVVLQVLSGRRLFTASVIPRFIGLIGSQAR